MSEGWGHGGGGPLCMAVVQLAAMGIMMCCGRGLHVPALRPYLRRPVPELEVQRTLRMLTRDQLELRRVLFGITGGPEPPEGRGAPTSTGRPVSR